jgi:pimeloyl-ACP methyl ester carboxylesterase
MSSSAASKSTWVLMRGLARESGHWCGFPDRLRAALGDSATVITPDTPGNGRRRQGPVPRTLGRSLDIVRADVEAEAPAATRGPTFVFGISMGGMIALEWAKRYGGELAGVVVGNASAGNLSRPWQRMRATNWPTLARSFLERDVTTRESAILRMVANDTSARPSTLAAWVDIARARPPVPRCALDQLLAATRFRAPEGPLGCPLLVLLGEGDRLVHPDCSRKLARHYGAPLATHPTAGHELSQDAPDGLIEHLLGFAAAQTRDRTLRTAQS